MLDKLGFFTRIPRLGAALAVLVAVTFNNWLLGPYLNRQLFDRNGSVSEFSALTQPHHWVFRSLDVTSGVLMVLLALYMLRKLPLANRAVKFLIGGTVVLGVANAIDALLPLHCSETLDAGCTIPVNISWSHYQMPSHGYSSIIIALCYLALPMAGLFYAASRKLNWLMIISAIATAVALEALVSAVLQYVSQNSFSTKTLGAGQEVQMIVVGVWFITWGLSVHSRSRSPAHELAKETARP